MEASTAAIVVGAIGLVLSAVAIVVSIATYRGARREARRSADAAVRSADASERALALQEAEATKYRVPWVLAHESGDMYRLVNDGDEPCEEVHIMSDDSLPLRGEHVPKVIGPREAASFFALPSMATTDRTITVTWQRPGSADMLTWRNPLPAKG